ncbi:phosphotransferase family protein [Pelagibius marinus]|uniref:phosphotransferase family protein n=1 Tax=Pelagibius marinus TaxID=2762760 RepID=UPI001872C907|nr:phosphotransferase [Pelagibius marinus]
MRENWERGTEVLPLSPEEASLLLQPILPGRRVTQVVPTEGGKANTNLRVELADSKRLLLRLFVRDPESGAKEAALLRRLAGRVPVPALRHFADDNPVSGHPYEVLEWIEGPRLKEALAVAGPGEPAALAREAGRVLAALGRETFPQAGFLAPDLTISVSYEPGSAGFLRFVEEMSTAPSAAARLDPRSAPALAGVLPRRGHLARRPRSTGPLGALRL